MTADTSSVEVHVAGRRGPRGRRGAVAEVILAAARERFAADGYAGTTLQGIARAAGVDTKLVRYYFTSKEALFAECLAVPPEFIERVQQAGRTPIDQRGEAMVRQLLDSWHVPQIALALRTMLLIAAHEETAMARLRMVFADGLVPSVQGGIPEAEQRVRAGLVSSQLLGLAITRYVYEVDQVAGIPEEIVVSAVGATVQRYLNGPL